MVVEHLETTEQLAAFQTVTSCAYANLRKTARAVTQLYDETFRPVGLRASQFALLVAVRFLEPVTVNQLADAVVMDRTTLTRNLKPLEKQGLIRIEPGAEDRRQREVSLAEAGKEKLAQAFPLWRRAQQKIESGMGEERLSQMVANLSVAVLAARGG